MADLLTALALILVLEGALFCLHPEGMKRLLAEVLTMPPQILRTAGLVSTMVGVVIVWLLRG